MLKCRYRTLKGKYYSLQIISSKYGFKSHLLLRTSWVSMVHTNYCYLLTL